MTVYSICPSDDYGFMSSHNLELMSELIDSVRFGKLGIQNCISNLKKSNKACGNICPIEVSCISIAVDNQVRGIYDFKERCIQIKEYEEYKFVVPPVIDALDVENSEILYFSGTNRIKRIKQYCFDVSKLSNADLFLIPNSVTPVMCTNEFRDCCVKNRFTGVDFQKIYSDSNEEE